MATASKPSDDDKTPAKASTAKSPSRKSEASYGEQAAQLAADTRALAERFRDELNDHLAKVDDLQQNAEPTMAEVPAADGVRRIPMAAGDVTQALEGLAAAAANLQRTTG